MNCPNCKARNPIGNKFCRECGQKIPLEENPLAAEEAQQAEAERGRERAAELLSRAFSLAQHGKPIEALPLAQEAVELLPESTSALTLCATLHERLRQNDKAIAMMERVVALNPDSAVDTDKLDQLRRGVHLLPRRPTTSEVEPVQQRRWLPVAVAVGAGILALGVGVTIVVRSNQSPVPRNPGTGMMGSPATPAPRTVERVSGNAPRSLLGPLSAPHAVRPDPFAPVGPTPLGATPTPAGPRAGRTTSPLLPNPRGVAPGLFNPGETPPFVLPGRALPPLGGVQRSQEPIIARPPQNNGQGNGPSIPAGPPQNNGQGQETGGNTPPPPENPGFIRIREHSGTGEPGVRTSANLPEEPLLKAQTLQASGKYREAILAYRDALSTGAVAGEVQQGIALCYQRLGEKSSARTAYQQAILAFEAQVRAGRSIEQASRGLAACRAALTVLGQGS